LYLAIIVLGIFAEAIVRSPLIVRDDAAATAKNILASESRWRLAFAGTLVMLVCAVGVALVMYVLLRPVNRNIALLAVFFNLVSISIEGINDLFHLTAVLLLGDATSLKTFEPRQVQTLAYFSLRLFGHGYGISLVFFGFWCIVTGYLIFKSTFFPRVLGVFMAIAGVCYEINSFALFLSPVLARALFPGIVLPAGLAELALCLWLIVVGVNVPKWEAKAKEG
jgi:hypothetical protein